jgi:hypothetical protein
MQKNAMLVCKRFRHLDAHHGVWIEMQCSISRCLQAEVAADVIPD